RTVEEFEDEGVGADLRERRHGRMAEGVVRLARHAGEVAVCDRAGRKTAHDLDRDLGIGPAGEARDRLAVEPWPGLRHIEATVAREPGGRDVEKAEWRGLARGGDVAHGFRPGRRRTAAARRGRSRRPMLSLSL